MQFQTDFPSLLSVLKAKTGMTDLLSSECLALPRQPSAERYSSITPVGGSSLKPDARNVNSWLIVGLYSRYLCGLSRRLILLPSCTVHSRITIISSPTASAETSYINLSLLLPQCVSICLLCKSSTGKIAQVATRLFEIQPLQISFK